ALLTTETQGLWYSNNMRSATPTFTPVANYPFRQPERVFYNPFNPNEIWVTSFGSGLRLGVVNGNSSPGKLQFSTAEYSVSEGSGTVTITVNRTGGSAGVVSVHYSTTDGTATAPADYTAASGTLTWADGDTAPKTFTVPIIDDTLTEGNEAFKVNLDGPTGGATLGTPASSYVVIVDNDTAQPAGHLQFSASS